MACKALFSLAAAALLSTSVMAAPAIPKMPIQQRDCGMKIFAARGTDQLPGLGSISAITDNILRFASDIQVSAVDYPASMHNPEYMDSVAAGARNLQDQIAYAVSQCSSVKIALIGYSQGAQVVGDALVGGNQWGSKAEPLNPQYQDNIKAIVLYGDPTHVSGQSFSVVNKNSNGMVPRQGDIECSPYSEKIVSFCNWGDPVCDVTGGDGHAHETYFSQYVVQSSWFTLSKLWFS